MDGIGDIDAATTKSKRLVWRKGTISTGTVHHDGFAVGALALENACVYSAESHEGHFLGAGGGACSDIGIQTRVADLY